MHDQKINFIFQNNMLYTKIATVGYNMKNKTVHLVSETKLVSNFRVKCVRQEVWASSGQHASLQVLVIFFDESCGKELDFETSFFKDICNTDFIFIHETVNFMSAKWTKFWNVILKVCEVYNHASKSYHEIKCVQWK